MLANVAAAETLAGKKTPLLYRVHEEPDPQKIEALREVAEASGLTLAKGQVMRTALLNRLLSQAAGTDQAELINMTTLRSMQQAYYSPANFGHFGLALRNYAHFHLAHPALCRSDRAPRADRRAWQGQGWPVTRGPRAAGMTAEQISDTERRSMPPNATQPTVIWPSIWLTG